MLIVPSGDRVLNAFKSMLQEDDVIGEEDMVILGKIRAFSMNITEKYLGPAVKRLVAVVEQVVSVYHSDIALGSFLTSTSYLAIQRWRECQS